MSDRWIAAAVTTIALGGCGSSNQLHPHATFLPTFDYLEVASQDGNGCLHPLWASKMLFRNLRVTSRTLRPCYLKSMDETYAWGKLDKLQN